MGLWDNRIEKEEKKGTAPFEKHFQGFWRGSPVKLDRSQVRKPNLGKNLDNRFLRMGEKKVV